MPSTNGAHQDAEMQEASETGKRKQAEAKGPVVNVLGVESTTEADVKDAAVAAIGEKAVEAAMKKAKVAEGVESDDDVPLSSLKPTTPVVKKSAAKAAAPTKKPEKSEGNAGKVTRSAKKETPAKKPKTVENKTPKDEIICDILCRWWYVAELEWPKCNWPEAAETMPDRPKAEWEPMAAFPWMFQNSAGSILNMRTTPERKPPSYDRLNAMGMADLKRILKEALQGQLKALPAGEDPKLKAKLEKWIGAVDSGVKPEAKKKTAK